MWTDGRMERRHFYHLSYQEYPIALAPGVEYRVISSRVTHHPATKHQPEYIEVRHLVQEIK